MPVKSVQGRVPDIIREGVCLLGGVVAILMQVAHPKVALAISEHSNFQEDVWHRINSTLTYLYLALLGTVGEGEKLATVVKLRHVRVRAGGKEMPYAASNADLLLWVNATVYSGMVNAFERAFGPMEEDLAVHVLQRFGRLGRLLLADSEEFEWPESREDFDEYWHKTYKTLTIHPKESKKLQETFFNIQKYVPWPSKIILVVAMPFLQAYATGCLPYEIRKQYGLNSTKSTRALSYLVQLLMHHVYPRLPLRLRQLPSEFIIRRARRFREDSECVK